MERITPGLLALVIGGVLAGVLFLPFVAASYRIRGRVTVARTIQWAALLIAFLALWAYTIFPAPNPDESYRCTTPNLDILFDLRDIIALQAAGDSLFANAALQVVVLNILFFVPIGFLVRTLFGWGVVRAATTGLLLSLAVETTQLTGLWGIYPCSYRLFSVTDLMHNTLGAVLGSLLALLFVRRGAGRTGIAGQPDVPNPRPAHLTAGRRMLGMAADAVLFFSTSAMVGMIIAVVGLATGRTQTNTLEEIAGILIALVVYLTPILLTGRSWGERAVMISVAAGWRPRLLSRLVRASVGVGGVMVISEFVPTIGGLIALAIAVTTVVLVLARRDRRGLGAILAGNTVGMSPRAEGALSDAPGQPPSSVAHPHPTSPDQRGDHAPADEEHR